MMLDGLRWLHRGIPSKDFIQNTRHEIYGEPCMTTSFGKALDGGDDDICVCLCILFIDLSCV